MTPPAPHPLLAALHRTVAPDRITSGPAYATLWNGAVTRRPAAVLHCNTPADVQAGIRAARESGVPLAVRGGGHDWAGRALADGGLTLDLSGMWQVDIDPDARVARIGGGTTSADLVSAAQAHGLVAVTGTSGSVGMAGLSLGGGYGPLSGRFGLAVDNVLAVDIVLADGSLVTADAEHEPELFWAVRGGGGNFGVVTSMRIRLHAVPALLSGMLVYPGGEADRVLAGLAELLPDGTPDELTVHSGFVTAPEGFPAFFVAPTWCGDPARGERELERLTRLGDPLLAQAGPATQTQLLAGTDALFPPGRHVEIATATVPALSPAVREILRSHGTEPTSPLSAVALHSLHGAASRIPLSDNAFGVRQPHLVVEVIAAWEPGDPATHRAWTADFAAALAPHALPGGYANLLGPGDARAAHAYGPNTGRLLAAKRHYDPQSIFHAIPLPAENPSAPALEQTR
ncbi:FAD-binding oxidoreductase [Nocardia barduliensis]|uniref:FAD-binding oxidoreductase n=1 Tax=Nocardia barduliensis TaxID=2736643 RepID=UPI0015725CA6|nr:FAD-binding oxidoreductase [Nocardia barduliensis]